MNDVTISGGNYQAQKESKTTWIDSKKQTFSEKCPHCHAVFAAENWHTPSECPRCFRSRVD